MPHMFVPGPVDVDPQILAAQAQPMLPHRSQEFETIFKRCWQNAQQIFHTQSRVFITTSSGTGLQEAAVRNFARRDVLSCINGAFGQRWYEVAITNARQADALSAPWGEPILPGMVSDALRKKHYDIVTLVHNETSTGLQNPVAEIAAAVRETSPDTLICVDAVSSLGGALIDTDAWGLDMVLTSSQKCLALPPGLGLAAVSDRAMAYAKQVPDRGWYFDLVRLEKHIHKDSTPATPAVSLIYALDVQLDHILDEGLVNRFARHTAMAKRVQAWALAHGFDLFAPEGYRSQTVTTIANTPSIDVPDLNTFLRGKGMRIANGYGTLKGKTFRIAHMGETQMSHADELLDAMETYLKRKT